MMPTGVTVGERALTVTWSDGSVATFHHLWLRDNCPQLRHPTTNHRVVETSAIPDDVHPAEATVGTDGCLHVRWAHDGHESCFTPDWLASHDYSRGVRRDRRAPRLWDGGDGDALPRASYPELLADPEVRRSYLRGFVDFGVGLLCDVPCESGSVRDVAEQFGLLRPTSWGTVFDVRAIDDANSVAYTNLPLVAHTDEGYRDPAPTVQFQHFLQVETTGGEATLVDGFKVATDLRAADPDAFARLATTSIHFHFRDATAEHEHDGPILELHTDSTLRAVRYSNHSAQPFLLPPDEMDDFYRAYRAFGAMREDPAYQVRLAMGAGDLYMVDNRRVMHGRTAFSSGGARHLQSCYIEIDELKSRLAMLEAAHGSLTGPPEA